MRKPPERIKRPRAISSQLRAACLPLERRPIRIATSASVRTAAKAAPTKIAPLESSPMAPVLAGPFGSDLFEPESPEGAVVGAFVGSPVGLPDGGLVGVGVLVVGESVGVLVVGGSVGSPVGVVPDSSHETEASRVT